MRTRVKICGITRRQDAIAAIESGADAIGLVFYPPSPRAVTVAQAKEITQALPAFVSVVGLFVNAQQDEVQAVLDEVPLSLLQFHGDESPAECEVWNMPYIKAVRMKEQTDLPAMAAQYSKTSGLLLDSYVPGVPGGTGLAFDWSVIPENLVKPVVLAGGLNPDNVAQAIKETRPYAVDVSGGVEQEKGIKSAEKIATFMQQVSSTN